MPPDPATPPLPRGLRISSFSGAKGSLSSSVNAYLLEGERPVLIDAGFSGKAGGMEGNLSAFGVGTLLLTHLHRDHAGGAGALSRAGFGVRLHRAETLLYADRIDGLSGVRYLRDGESVESPLGPLVALHTPGHARGHLCFHWEGEGILFSGDLVTGEPSSWVGTPDGDMADYLASLRRIAGLPLRLLLSGHGPPVENPAEKIEAYIQRRLEREGDILRLLGNGEAAVPDLTCRIYHGRGLSPGLQGFAEKTVEAHLVKLYAEGRVKRLAEDVYALT